MADGVRAAVGRVTSESEGPLQYQCVTAWEQIAISHNPWGTRFKRRLTAPAFLLIFLSVPHHPG